MSIELISVRQYRYQLHYSKRFPTAMLFNQARLSVKVYRKNELSICQTSRGQVVECHYSQLPEYQISYRSDGRYLSNLSKKNIFDKNTLTFLVDTKLNLI